MAQVRYLLLEEVAFRWLELQPVVSEAIKYSLELCKVILWCFKYTITSSKYTMVNERLSSPKQFCIRHWKVARALQRPYGMQRNSYTPMLPTVNAVYWRDSSDTLTCQKLLLRSMVEK